MCSVSAISGKFKRKGSHAVPYALPSYLVSSPFTSSHFPAPCPRILLPRRRAPERSAVDITSFRVNRATMFIAGVTEIGTTTRNAQTAIPWGLQRERNSGSHESGSRNQDNTAGTSTRSEVHSGNSNQNRRARQQQYSPKHDTAQEISQGISEVNHHIPGILGEGISTEGLRNQLSNDERVSPMLDRVLRLFGASSAKANGPRERVLLDEAKQAYGLESEEPTLATIKATFLLSSWLSEWKPVYAENLLDNAYECSSSPFSCLCAVWLIVPPGLSSHNRHEQLKYVPSHEIHQLLDRVLAFVRLRIVWFSSF
ncbi:uncharacterized protein EI90DRAFT_2124349 [Cantharellus anzutake]|uniref:uncharacterized protein n=1 Tax=Cantharellus anzutake TaxID=1750568 RepID=UPI00190580CA|nr:uncharacterized protein EI90DRAFT_2124349 [Cantharellus anzutake]KAF8325583.1 hypothetical protein EI90DRAFT_2124349 [Cantharellus anzutake]